MSLSVHYINSIKHVRQKEELLRILSLWRKVQTARSHCFHWSVNSMHLPRFVGLLTRCLWPLSVTVTLHTAHRHPDWSQVPHNPICHDQKKGFLYFKTRNLWKMINSIEGLEVEKLTQAIFASKSLFLTQLFGFHDQKYRLCRHTD